MQKGGYSKSKLSLFKLYIRIHCGVRAQHFRMLQALGPRVTTSPFLGLKLHATRRPRERFDTKNGVEKPLQPKPRHVERLIHSQFF